MATIISRAQANLPPVPSSVGTRSLSSWTGIKVHHTGGAFSSWRAIHDWQTEGRPDDEELIYIGYSFGIANGRVTELRGWDRSPAHDHQNSTIGVVLGGNYQNSLPSEEDLEALVWFCREARLRTGKRLPITGHRDTWPRGDSRYSACPGDRLYAHLPTLRARVDNEEDEMPTAKEIAKAFVDELEERRFPRADGKPGGITLPSSADWARHHAGGVKTAVATQVVPQLSAILAAVGGEDVQQVVRAELDAAAVRERAERQQESAALAGSLGPALAGTIADSLRGQLPDITAEQLTGPIADGLRQVLREGVGEPAGDGS